MDPATASEESHPHQFLQIPSDTFIRLLEVIELAARRGAFEIEEYRAIGELYSASRFYVKA